MKLKYPAEAFALGIVLFSRNMKEAFAGGILVLLAVVFAEFLKNLLENWIPVWSLRLCVLMGTGAVTASAFLLGFTALGITVDNGTWLMTAVIGLLAGKTALFGNLEADYGNIFYESGILWGFWILLGILREFLTQGTVFGNLLLEEVPFFSQSFQGTAFGFLAAGLVLAFANGVLKKKSSGTQSLFLVIPVILFARPFEMVTFGGIIAFIWTVGVSVLLYISVQKILRFSNPGPYFRGLPLEMLSMSFIYLILSIY